MFLSFNCLKSPALFHIFTVTICFVKMSMKTFSGPEEPGTDIELEIEGKSIICKKELLIANSDYFKAMFEGNFIEKNKSKVSIEGVNIEAMDIILTILWDEHDVVLEEGHTLAVVQAASMLQFEKIKTFCIRRLMELLCPQNSIRIWIVTEQLGIKPLHLKAKFLALSEFMILKNTEESEGIYELTFQEVCNYLGHINLKTDNELSVFQTAMRWWYENSKQIPDTVSNPLLKILHCISFSTMSAHELKEAMTYPDIKNDKEILEIMSCMEHMKTNKSAEMFTENSHKVAKKLISCRSREVAKILCILVTPASETSSNDHEVVYYDDYKRKWFHEKLGDNKDKAIVLMYDAPSKKFKKFFNIDQYKCKNLEGFKLQSYKEFVFMYGGEFLIGRGKWNQNFWVYDTLRDRWERKTVMPHPRRHFQTCVVGSKVFIAGGTGTFRVTQDSLFWYDFKLDRWCEYVRHLLFRDKQFKCCCFLDQFFVISINEQCGYFLKDDVDTYSWTRVEAIIDRTILSNQSEFAVFSYRDRLFIKGKNLIEMKIEDNVLVVISIRHVTDIDCDKIDIDLCNNIVYTLYKHRFEEHDVCSLESYNLDTQECSFIFENLKEADSLEADKEQFRIKAITASMSPFAFEHYSLLDHYISVNEFEF
ncbi:unnamed protein product [Acanthoscelides obtectus]|uniref:BTB domain-containing protein n=1 Tax=Acanthoscelides obtectus TaxID=200917 RepID=A0A9P0KND6_ACAOB|nr:unnamed protein product [Acanthoscelides obtectus]CAK1635074.1 Kelch-like protein 38 [Acanthoscelides obtectus]